MPTFDIWQGPECASEYVCKNVVKKTFNVKAVFWIKITFFKRRVSIML